MRARALLVVLVALLAVAAMPASAQNASAVASEHTTFGTGSAGEPSPTTLTNMSVEGSGESASVTLQSGVTVVESFEDGTDSYGGDTGEYSTSTSNVADGSVSLTASAPAGVSDVISDTDFGHHLDTEYRAWVTMEAGTGGAGYFALTQDEDATPGGYLFWLRPGSDEIVIYHEDGAGTFDELNTTSASLSSDTQYQLEWEVASNGEIRFAVNDDTGSQLGVITATDTRHQSGGLGLRVLEGGAYFDAVSSNVSHESGTYVSAAHSAEDVAAGWTNLSLQNAEADVTWQEDGDGDGTWTNVTSTTVASTTNVTQDLSGTAADRWRVRVDVTATSGSTAAEIRDEGLLFEAESPTLSDADPTGQVASYDGDISINVSDQDFGLAQGDTVVVEATNSSGGQIGTQSVTANGTVTFSYSAPPGQNDVEWTATDEYGNSDSFTQSFTTPATLSIYKETQPSELIDDANTTLRVRFFADNGAQVVEREVTSGTVNLAGLPANDRFVVTVRANDTDQYTYRRIVIESIYETSEIYLLNESKPNSQLIFGLDDPTGQFPPDETILQVEKPITKDHDGDGTNETRYQVIAGDTFGASARFPVVLRDDERYRLRVYTEDLSNARTLGAYSVAGSTTETLQIKRIEPSGSSDSGATVYGGISEDGGTRQLAVRYQDPDARTDEVEYRILYPNGSVWIQNTTRSSDRFADVYPLPASTNNSTAGTWRVEYVIDRGGGQRAGHFVAGQVPGIADRLPIDAQVLSIVSWIVILAMMGLLVIVDVRLAPMGGVGMASALTIMGTVAIPMSLLGVAGAISVFTLVGAR